MLITQQQVEKLIGHNLLSQWEKGFIESVNDQMKRGRTLSSNQERIVNRCIEKTTPEKVAEGEEWAKEYRANHREIALICAKYYKSEGYFTFLSTSILEDEDFVPSKQQFTKMCENKYAKRVIENSKSPFQFGLGDLAKVRKVVGRNHLAPAAGSEVFHYNKLRNEAVIIIDREDPVEKPGQYKLVCCSLVVNPAIRFWCEERKLKTFRR